MLECCSIELESSHWEVKLIPCVLRVVFKFRSQPIPIVNLKDVSQAMKQTYLHLYMEYSLFQVQQDRYVQLLII